MPRHVREPKKPSAKYDELVARLAAELREPIEAIQPIIMEDGTNENRTLRINVIWQLWHDVPHEIRAAVILDAYEVVFGSERRQQITLALGFDFWEARNIGLLPYSLRPSTKTTEEFSKSTIHEAMRTLGAPVEYTDHGPQLWFATLEDAEIVKVRIESDLTGSSWTIVEETRGENW